MITVIIPGPPVPQGRGRVVTVAGHGAIADPKRSKDWKGTAQVHMMQACPVPQKGPLAVEIVAAFPCPGSDHRKRDPRPRRWHTKATGDADNIAKAVLDSANGVLYEDDRQVAALTVRKYIAAQGEPAFVQVKLWSLPVGDDGEALDPAITDPRVLVFDPAKDWA